MGDMVCLECWRPVGPDLHFDCTGEHEVPKAAADALRVWLSERYRWMVSTGQRELLPGSGAVV